MEGTSIRLKRFRKGSLWDVKKNKNKLGAYCCITRTKTGPIYLEKNDIKNMNIVHNCFGAWEKWTEHFCGTLKKLKLEKETPRHGINREEQSGRPSNNPTSHHHRWAFDTSLPISLPSSLQYRYQCCFCPWLFSFISGLVCNAFRLGLELGCVCVCVGLFPQTE